MNEIATKNNAISFIGIATILFWFSPWASIPVEQILNPLMSIFGAPKNSMDTSILSSINVHVSGKDIGGAAYLSLIPSILLFISPWIQKKNFILLSSLSGTMIGAFHLTQIGGLEFLSWGLPCSILCFLGAFFIEIGSYRGLAFNKPSRRQLSERREPTL